MKTTKKSRRGARPSIKILAAELTPDGSGYSWLSGWTAEVSGRRVECYSAGADALAPGVLAEVERRAERFARGGGGGGRGRISALNTRADAADCAGKGGAGPQ